MHLNRKLCKLAIAQTSFFKKAKVITCKLINKQFGGRAQLFIMCITSLR